MLTIDLDDGNDKLILSGGGTATVSNVETIQGGASSDVVVLLTNADGASVDLAGGNDSLTLAAGANSLHRDRC